MTAPPPIPAELDRRNPLVRYDAMCRAIDAAYEVDEVKDIRDKAMAIEHYSRQAKNTEAERRACEIRLRAERKAGQLLAGMEKAKPTGSNQYEDKSRDTTDPQRLADLGISRDQSSRWQALGRVPEDEFEAALAAPEKPTTSGIIAKPKSMPDTSLWLWGRLRDFERQGLLSMGAAEATEMMTDAMVADVKRLAPLVAHWLDELENDL